jgi:uncharacterized protein (TIGR04255 family)
MPLTFGTAPLIELIVELRWNSMGFAGQVPQPGQLSMVHPIFIPGSLDGFFKRFGDQVDKIGFRRSERTIPDGYPIFPHQPVYRFRKPENPESQLFQIGAGLFSANATPPYKSWDSFSPIVKDGIRVLLLSRDPEDQGLPFSVVSLRYIDSFGPYLTGDGPLGNFVSDVLGFKINLPDVVSSLLPAGEAIRVKHQLTIPTKEDMVTMINIGEGIVNGARSLVMDTTVSSTMPLEPDIDALMGKLHLAHGNIRRMFMEMTQKIHHLMQPSESE